MIKKHISNDTGSHCLRGVWGDTRLAPRPLWNILYLCYAFHKLLLSWCWDRLLLDFSIQTSYSTPGYVGYFLSNGYM